MVLITLDRTAAEKMTDATPDMRSPEKAIRQRCTTAGGRTLVSNGTSSKPVIGSFILD